MIMMIRNLKDVYIYVRYFPTTGSIHNYKVVNELVVVVVVMVVTNETCCCWNNPTTPHQNMWTDVGPAE